MSGFVDILRCPVTHRDMRWASAGELAPVGGGPTHPYVDGVAYLLPGQGAEKDASQSIRDFYQGQGWVQNEHGQFKDTQDFVDTRTVAFDFTRNCMARLGKYFAKGGEYLLDAGSGPIAHEELLQYGEKFQCRVCIDLSPGALRVARTKVGDRGACIQADLTNLPVKTGSMDAVMCYHVIYQIEAEKQADAFRELWRVLKPGGVGVIVYWWRSAPLEWRANRLAKILLGAKAAEESPDAESFGAKEDFYHHPQPLDWFQSQDWPFRYRLDTYRIVSNYFLRNRISSDWRGRTFLNAMMAFQNLAPGYCGKYGLMPAIIIYKD